jgi:hypothetical protein
VYHGAYETLGTFGTLLVCFSPLKALKKAFLDCFFDQIGGKIAFCGRKLTLNHPKRRFLIKKLAKKITFSTL